MISGLGSWVLDLLLVGLFVAQAVAGWRQGMLVGLASLGGFVVGLIGGGLLVVEVVAPEQSGPMRLLAVLAGAIVGGVVLQALGVTVAHAIRSRIEDGPVRVADAVVGVVVALGAAALVVWVLSWGLRTAPLPLAGSTVAQSRVVAALDSLAPAPAQEAADRFFARVTGEWFPRVFTDERERIRDVPPPDSGIAATPGVQAAAAGMVKVTGLATACGRAQEGSGFVVADGVAVTNAHVVAGMPEPMVQVGGEGRLLPGAVVAFDPSRDLAVLQVPELTAPALALGEGADQGEPIAVAGFPNDGPYVVEPGRVREELRAAGADIYGNEGAVRDVYSLFATVQPGNSGGPVLSADGEVVGVVFARSTTDSSTGYALTVEELEAVLPTVGAAPVDVGPCSVG